MEVLEALRAAMWIIGALAGVANIVIGLILGYHLIRFSGNSGVANVSIVLYSIVSLLLLLFMLGSIPA